jgi:hypothetical protein
MQVEVHAEKWQTRMKAAAYYVTGGPEETGLGRLKLQKRGFRRGTDVGF